MQRIIRNLWVIVFLMPALLLAGLTKEPYQEGKHYRLLKEPVQTSVSPDNIEVAEVFWYGCPHCYSLETEVNRWKPSMPKEARFIRIPGFFGPNLWKTHAQLYYTLESLLPDKKDFEPVHDAVFQGIQKRTISLASEKEMAEYLSKHHKIDKEKFRKYYQSFGIEKPDEPGLFQGARLSVNRCACPGGGWAFL